MTQDDTTVVTSAQQKAELVERQKMLLAAIDDWSTAPGDLESAVSITAKSAAFTDYRLVD
jgi:hypothetical protein